MVKEIYQLPPRTMMELLHSNIWCSDGVQLINNGFTYARRLDLFRKKIRCVDDVWDSEQRVFLSWNSAQRKFNLTLVEEDDWTIITGKLSEKWRHRLEEDSNTAYQGQWVGFCTEGEGDPALVIHCTNEFAPTYMQLHHLSLQIPVQCYTVGTYSRCFREWENPVGDIVGFFHKVKIIHTTRGPKKEGVREEIRFFYGKMATLGWDPDRWRWVDGDQFLNYTTKLGKELLSSRDPGITRAAEKWQGCLPPNYRFYWSQVWDPLHAGKEVAFMWSIWHKAVAVNKWRAKIAPASISKQCPFCLPNTSESVKHKF